MSFKLFVQLKGAIGIKGLVLVDIHSDYFNSVGRPKVNGTTTSQMRHVTPYSFIENIIKTAVIDSKIPELIIQSFVKMIKILVKNKSGFSFHSEEMKNYGSPLNKEIVTKAKKVIQNNNSISYLISPDKIKSTNQNKFTPKKQETAKLNFNQDYEQFVEIALKKLLSLIHDDYNTSIITAEILARYMFEIFNTRNGTSFPKEGNTQDFQIRLYHSKEEALEPKGKSYEVISVKNLKNLIKDKGLESVSEKIRLINCEGPDTKKVSKSLNTLDKIIEANLLNQNLTDHIDAYSKIKGLKLVLANNDEDISKYHEVLNVENFEKITHLHIAKLIYYVFDFKALEEDVVIADKRGEILLYNNAKSKKLTKYSFYDGAAHRQDEIDGANGKYSKKTVKFRDETLDLKCLEKKLVDHFVMSTFAYNAFSTKKDLLSNALEELVNLASIDYELNKEDKTQLLQDAKLDYTQLISENSFDPNIGITLIGSDLFGSGIFDN